MKFYGLSIQGTYSQISDSTLDNLVSKLSLNFRMISSFLRTSGYRIQERRVRDSLARVDPLSLAYRRSRNHAVVRRVYRVPYPNAIWHIDCNLSLVRWKFVVQGGVDGYSRLITFLHCSSDNTASTMLKSFVSGGRQFGFPSRVRSDYGGENFDVAKLMLYIRGENRGSHLTGKSIHNQRIERLWRDVFSDCLSLYYHLFYFLESESILDCENALHIQALNYVYTPRINQSLLRFQCAWNHHPLRTANNMSPIQLWTSGMLQHYNSQHMPVQEAFTQSSMNDTSEDQLHTSPSEDDEDLLGHLNPLQASSVWGIDLYVTALEILLNQGSTSDMESL